MLSFDYQNHTHIVFGQGTEKQVGNLIKAYHAQKVMIHFGGQSARNSGLLDRIEKALREADIDFIEFGGVVPNPRLSLAKKGIEICKKKWRRFYTVCWWRQCCGLW